MRWTWMAVLALAAGCDGIQLERLVQQHEARTRVAAEPPGSHCPHGGSALMSGLDLNDNGALDDSEVTSTDYACATALTRKEAEAAGVNCALGGQAFHTGVDVDGDGTLDAAEVTATEYLCATAIPDVLVRTQAVPPGTQCPRGGQVSRAGRDTNGNGTLEDDEVTREVHGCTQPETVVTRVRAFEPPPFICAAHNTSVEAGPDADGDGVLDDAESRARLDLCADASRVLVKLLPEPTGARCPAGGTRVVAGEDKNQDGELDASEPPQETFVCQPLHTYFGNYTVRNAADLEALRGISHIQGYLDISQTDLTEVVLPGLSVVEGQVFVYGNNQLTRLELPGLRFVGESLQVSSHPLLKALALGGAWNEPLWVETHFDLNSNARLASLEGLAFVSPRVGLGLQNNDALDFAQGQPGFQAVRTLSGNLLVSGNNALRALPFPNLQHVNGMVQLTHNASLQSLYGPALASIGSDLWVINNDSLRSLWGMTGLQVISGWLTVSGNDGLRSTEGLGALARVGGLSFTSNAELEWMGDLPALQSVGGPLELRENPKLLGLRNLGTVPSLTRLALADNPLLADLSPLAGTRRVEDLVVQRNPSLTGLGALSGLQELLNLDVAENANLAGLELNALRKVSMEFFVTGNPKLPTCQVNALVEAVHVGDPALRRISGNDDTATCGN